VRSTPFIIIEDTYRGGIASFVRTRFFCYRIRRVTTFKVIRLEDRADISP
jgi:hypothetical protein